MKYVVVTGASGGYDFIPRHRSGRLFLERLFYFSQQKSCCKFIIEYKSTVFYRAFKAFIVAFFLRIMYNNYVRS